MLDLESLYKRHASVFAGAMRYALEQSWDSIIDEYVDDTLPTQVGKPIPYDGIIARATNELALRANRLKIPLVNIWLSSPVCTSLPGVFPDYAAAGIMRAEHLLARGYRRFAGLISDNNRAHELENEAFISSVNSAGCPCISEVIPLHTSDTVKKWRKTEQAIAAFMDKWVLPIGVFVGNDMNGRIVAQMCRTRGWRVPQDVAIITGSNEELICEHIRPTLSSVEFGYERVGYEAARLLNRLMDGESAPTEALLLAPTGVIARESTDFFAVDNKLISTALEFIAAHSHLQIGADDVAKAVNTQTRTLQRHFHNYLKRPIATEIRNVRIERAKQELTQSNHTLAQIAKDVGFGQAMRMYEVFRRELGITPNQYRKERQEPK